MAEDLAMLEEAVRANEQLVILERRRFMIKQKYIKRIKEFGACPICFSPVDEATLTRIQEEL
jgi:hypothetical protein